MIMDLSTFNATTGYSPKAATPLMDFSPATVGSEIMGPLTKNGSKVIGTDGADGLVYVVNPLDYWTTIFPATTPYVDAMGVYKYKVLPLPGTFVQSAAMPQGRLVAGRGKDYFMGVGTARRFEVLKELRAIEDETVYLTKIYGNGKPEDNDSFLVFDITGMDGYRKAIYTRAELEAMTKEQLVAMGPAYGLSLSMTMNKGDLVDALLAAM
jgi:hypothetical protein